jgi:glycosyltransferase involved in cell wall biosynthesis
VKRRVAIVTHGFDTGGGVPAIARWLRSSLTATGRYTVDIHDLATSSRDPHSRRLVAPGTWFQPDLCVSDTAAVDFSPNEATETVDLSPNEATGPSVFHWGANAVELEFMRYRPRAGLTRVLRGYDLIQVVCGTAAWAGVASRAGRPVVVQVATRAAWERAVQLTAVGRPLRTWRQAMTAITTRLEKSATKKADAVLVENDTMVAAVEQTGQRRVVKAPPGVDTTRFLPAFDGWRKDGHLLSVCRLGDPRKGLDRLVRAYAVLCAEAEPAPRLVLAGKGRLLPATRELIEDLKLTKRIDVRTDVPDNDLVGLYQSASVFVQTSHEEGLGLSVLEAMACGLPVVATDTAGSRETVVDGLTGWRVAQGADDDVSAEVAKRIRQLLVDGETASRQARRRCVDRFSSDATLDLYLGVYENLLDSGYPSLKAAT